MSRLAQNVEVVEYQGNIGISPVGKGWEPGKEPTVQFDPVTMIEVCKQALPIARRLLQL